MDAYPTAPAFYGPLKILQASNDPSRWFVLEQEGYVHVFPVNNPAANTTYLNISGRVNVVEEVLLTINKPSGFHHGGDIDFGNDGFLYMGVGNGGDANDPLNSGQDTREEINLVVRGGNYGWRCREGTLPLNMTDCPASGFVEPVLNYGRNDGNAVTGGFMYRGTALPNLVGRYVFGDFAQRIIWALQPDSQGGYTQQTAAARFQPVGCRWRQPADRVG